MKPFYFLLISFVVLFPLIRPFLAPGRAWTYDVDYHNYRMAAFHQAVVEGNIPPRWASSLVYGWGSPVFIFNWTLPYWMGEPFLFAGWSITDASKAVVILSIVLSYVCMFLFLHSRFGFWAGVGGAALYQWALFRIYLLFTGGGLGMEMAFVFWPLLFLGVEKRSFVLIAIATACSLLSHQVMFLMIQPLFWLYAWNRRANVLVPFLVGLGLSAYFWIPAFFEQQFINIGITKTLYKDHFLDLATIFHQPGITDRIPPLRFWYWSTGWNLFAIVLVSIVMIKKTKHLWLFIAFFFIGLFLMTDQSRAFWKGLPLLSNFIYPVRFQALMLFCASILGAFIIAKSGKSSWILALVCIGGTMMIHSLAIPTNWPRADIPDEFYYQGDSTVDMMGEYLPTPTNIEHFFDDQTRFERHPIGRIVEGEGAVTALVKRSSDLTFVVDSQTPVSVVINQLAFPGWKIEANGKEVLSEIYGNGEMVIKIPAGITNIQARFADTPLRTLGNIITVVTFIGMIGWGLWKPRRFVI